MIVTTGQENTMHSASGTAIYVTLARAVMKVMAAATPDKLKKIIIENLLKQTKQGYMKRRMV